MSRRNYLCTIHFDQDKDPYLSIPMWENAKWLKEVRFQLERGENTGRLHWQVFLELKNPKKWIEIQKTFPMLSIDLSQLSNKHPNAGRNYVHKAATNAGSRHCWLAKSGYATICRHQKGVHCSCTIPAEAIRVLRPNVNWGKHQSEKTQLDALVKNKLEEMKMWNAFLEDKNIQWIDP